MIAAQVDPAKTKDKTKKDVIYKGKIGVDLKGNVNYGIGTYFLISFKKKE